MRLKFDSGLWLVWFSSDDGDKIHQCALMVEVGPEIVALSKGVILVPLISKNPFLY